MGSGKSGEEQCGRGQVATPDSDVAGGVACGGWACQAWRLASEWRGIKEHRA